MTLVSTVYVLRDYANLKATIAATGWKMTLKAGAPDCPAEASFVKANKKKVEAARKNLPLPPFFPGDTTSITLLK